MTRFRTFFLLLLLVLLSAPEETVRAAAEIPATAWTPGIYIGTISINAHEYVEEKPLPEFVLHSEHELEILMSTGRMHIVIDNKGKMSTSFSVPIRFKYMDWSQCEDVGTGICEGMKAELSGHGTLGMNEKTSPGNTFTGKAEPFKVDGFSGSIRQFGKRCPEVSLSTARSDIESGFVAMFSNNMEFQVKMTKGAIVAGYCYLPGFELEGDHAFDCTWFVQRYTKKK